MPGRDAERDQVGERVVLDAELARRCGEARDAAVEAVADVGHHDAHRRDEEVAAALAITA